MRVTVCEGVGTAPPTARAEALERDRPERTMRLFNVAWAAAALFHVLGPSGRAYLFIDAPTTVGLGHVGLAIVALMVLAKPANILYVAILAAMGPATAWQESPFLGSHWLLVSLVDLGLILSMITSARGDRIDGQALATSFLPVVRWTVVIFYCFTAFAKMNTAFLDSTVSCATFYFDQIAASVGLSQFVHTEPVLWTRYLPVAVVATEAMIPLLLLIPRTRIAGVLVAIVFHGIIALDSRHLFIDFSSVMTALFVPFLPLRVIDLSTTTLAENTQRWVTAVALSCFGVVFLCQLNAQVSALNAAFASGRLWLWYVYDAATLFLLGRSLVRPTPSRGCRTENPAFWIISPRLLWTIPLLVVVNGALPYVELRTAFAFNMYSNLRIVEGRTNHLIVPFSIPIGNRHFGLVRILSSNDPALALYATAGYDLPWDSFRIYLWKHPGATVRFRRLGEEFQIQSGLDSAPAPPAPVVLWDKLLPLRAIDQQALPRCQDVFFPAL